MTRCNFGWWYFYLPAKATIGTQADMWEFGQSVSVAWRCPITVSANLDALKKHPRTADIFETMRRWEEFREKNLMTDEERQAILSNYRQEHHLLKLADGSYRIVPYEQIEVGGGSSVRAFLFETDGYRWVVYWDGEGSSRLTLPVGAGDVALFDEFAGKPIAVKGCAGGVTVPAARRAYLRTSLSACEARKAFATATCERE